MSNETPSNPISTSFTLSIPAEEKQSTRHNVNIKLTEDFGPKMLEEMEGAKPLGEGIDFIFREEHPAPIAKFLQGWMHNLLNQVDPQYDPSRIEGWVDQVDKSRAWWNAYLRSHYVYQHKGKRKRSGIRFRQMDSFSKSYWPDYFEHVRTVLARIERQEDVRDVQLYKKFGQRCLGYRGKLDVKTIYDTPYLVDYADGVKGHFCVGRMVKSPSGDYQEVWLPRSNEWGTGSGVTWTQGFAEKVRIALTEGKELPTAVSYDIMSEG